MREERRALVVAQITASGITDAEALEVWNPNWITFPPIATSDLDVGMSEKTTQLIRWRVPLFLNCPTAELVNSLLSKLYFPYFRCMIVTRKTFDNVQPIYSQLKFIKTS